MKTDEAYEKCSKCDVPKQELCEHDMVDAIKTILAPKSNSEAARKVYRKLAKQIEAGAELHPLHETLIADALNSMAEGKSPNAAFNHGRAADSEKVIKDFFELERISETIDIKVREIGVQKALAEAEKDCRISLGQSSIREFYYNRKKHIEYALSCVEGNDPKDEVEKWYRCWAIMKVERGIRKYQRKFDELSSKARKRTDAINELYKLYYDASK
jgi:hypothetical protein